MLVAGFTPAGSTRTVERESIGRGPPTTHRARADLLIQINAQAALIVVEWTNSRKLIRDQDISGNRMTADDRRRHLLARRRVMPLVKDLVSDWKQWSSSERIFATVLLALPLLFISMTLSKGK